MDDDRLIRIEADIAAIQSALDLMRFDIGVAERRSDGNAARVVDAHERISQNSDRLHTIEGAIDDMQAAMYRIATEFEALKQARQAGDAG